MSHIVKVVADEELQAEPGWAIVQCCETGTLVFLIRRSAAVDERALTDAWDAARRVENAEIEAAVRAGHSST